MENAGLLNPACILPLHPSLDSLMFLVIPQPDVPHIEVDPVDAVEHQEEEGREHQEESERENTKK